MVDGGWWMVDGSLKRGKRQIMLTRNWRRILSALGLASPDSKATSGDVTAFGWSGTGWHTAVRSSNFTTVRERKAERSYL
jgi:hypothetical protein